MTIEEKAKAYDGALERAKHVKLTNTKENVAAAEYIFPELAESEDERIRKELIDIIKRSYEIGGFTLNNKELRDKYIAYLERQKEQKFADETMEEKDRIDSAFTKMMEKEQKPTSFNEPYNPDEYEVVMEGNATSLKRKEQKSAEYLSVRDDFDLEGNLKTKSAGWSDEDEGMLGSIIRLGALDNAQSYWLKRICSILRQQKPVEWSDGDENRFNYLLHLINESGENEATKKGLTDFINRIRSLGPQQWKPTDEQYYALRDAIIKLDADDSDARFPWEGLPVLHSLANDLFDLRKK